MQIYGAVILHPLVLMFCCLSDDVECNWTEKHRQLAAWAFGRWKFYQYASLRVGLHYFLLFIAMVTVVVVVTVKKLLRAVTA